MVLIEKMKSYGLSLNSPKSKVFWNGGDNFIILRKKEEAMYLYSLIPKEYAFKKDIVEQKTICEVVLNDIITKDKSVFLSGMFVGKLTVRLLGKRLYYELKNHIVLGIKFPYTKDFINIHQYDKVINFSLEFHNNLLRKFQE